MIVAALRRPRDIECQFSNLGYYRVTEHYTAGPFRGRLEKEFDDYKPIGPNVLVGWDDP